MADIVGEPVSPGDAIVDYDNKVFPDHQAEPGQKAYVFYHAVPFESSASLVNLLTATRIRRKGFDTSIVFFGPGSLAVALWGVAQGVQMIRVHDVAETRQALSLWQASVKGEA